MSDIVSETEVADLEKRSKSMKVVLAGAYGNLGADVFRTLIKEGHEVVALDMMQRDIGVTDGFEFVKIDVTDPKTLEGVCDAR